MLINGLIAPPVHSSPPRIVRTRVKLSPPRPCQAEAAPTRPPGRIKWVWVLVWLAWLTAAVVAIRWLNSPSSPDVAATPPGEWPTETTLQLASDRPTLVMFVHPHCPCTRRSLSELSDIVTADPNRVTTVVVVYSPDGVPDGWARTERWTQAAAIPGVTVIEDRGEYERQRFTAVTSGQVMVYDTAGRLRFSGGITADRHGGPNPGRAAVEQVLRGVSDTPTETAVFGCPLVCEQVPEGR